MTWSLCLGLLLSVLRAQETAPSSPSFVDVPPSHWAAKAVHQLKDEGILIGYPDGTFQASLRGRAQALEVLKEVFDFEWSCKGVVDIGEKRGFSRYEAAVLVNGCVYKWEDEVNKGSAKANEYMRYGTILLDLAAAYRTELEDLGVDYAKLIARLHALAD